MPDVNNHIKSFFNFLEKRDNRKAPARYKFAHEPESLTPEDLDIKSNLDLTDTKITTLPKGLKVDGNLNLSNTEITSLPEDLKVGGNLNLSNTEITSLPKGLKVGGNLNLRQTKITSLPEDLQVGRDLSLDKTPITTLPKGLKVGRDLELGNTLITTLPQGLKVSGYLDLDHSKITSLPEDLKVSGNLYLKNTEITSIPSGLQVGGNIIMTTPPENYPENLADKIYIGGASLTKVKEIYAEYNSLPDIEIKVGKAVKKGKGREYPYSSLSTAIPSTSFAGRSLRKVLSTLTTSFGIDWEKIYITQELRSDQVIGTTEETYVVGTDSKGREVLYKTDGFDSTLVSDQGKAAISNILTASGRQLSPRAVAEIESKLFPNNAEETAPKLDKKAIKAKLDNPNNPLVRITFGRRTRGGKGIEGKPEDLLPLIQSASQEKVYALGQKLGITWDKMIIYKEDGDTLYALTGKDKSGKEYMIDRAGHGGGSYTKVYSGGGTNLTISRAIDSTPEDYKE